MKNVTIEIYYCVVRGNKPFSKVICNSDMDEWQFPNVRTMRNYWKNFAKQSKGIAIKLIRLYKTI